MNDGILDAKSRGWSRLTVHLVILLYFAVVLTGMITVLSFGWPLDSIAIRSAE